jgi:GYF domain 2
MIYRTDEDQNWFYVDEGRRQGPLDRRGLVHALLERDAPEKALVWRSGLVAWTKAGDLQELKIELPPPLPRQEGRADHAPHPDPPPLPTEDGTLVASRAPSSEGEAESATDASRPSPDTAHARRRHRRRRKRKHSETTSHNPRVLELLALFLVLALVLWFLLRRMNRVPEGTIIDQGRLHATPEALAPPPRFASFGTIPEGPSPSRL